MDSNDHDNKVALTKGHATQKVDVSGIKNKIAEKESLRILAVRIEDERYELNRLSTDDFTSPETILRFRNLEEMINEYTAKSRQGVKL